MRSNDINNYLSEQEKRSLNVALRQMQVMVECGMVEGNAMLPGTAI